MTDRDAEYVEFVRSMTPRLRRTAYLICADWHRAEDAVQEHTGSSLVDSGWAKLYRDGKLIVDRTNRTFIDVENVAGEPADFKLVTSEARPSLSSISTRMDLEWTFRSQTAGPGGGVDLPFWAVRYAPAVDDHNVASRGAGQRRTVPDTWTKAAVRRVAENRYLAVFATRDELRLARREGGRQLGQHVEPTDHSRLPTR